MSEKDDTGEPSTSANNPGKEQPEAEPAYDSLHGTNNYITTWDTIVSQPSDVYACQPSEDSKQQ